MQQTHFSPKNHETIGRSALRKRAGLTLFELAKLIGRSAGTLSQWERMQVQLPRSDVEKIARVIGDELSRVPARDATEIVSLLLGLQA
jgi:transcriptional regulator with XRE-family HTH domain